MHNLIYAPLTLVKKNYKGFDFYCSSSLGNRPALWNIVPTGKECNGGYYARNYIEGIMKTKFPDRYQPTLHGMTELYPTPFGLTK